MCIRDRNYSDDDWISRFVSAVLDAEGTRRQSIQDMPNEEEYIKIDINCRGSVNTLFVYKEKEIYYIEQTYQGIYQTDASSVSYTHLDVYKRQAS